MQRQAAVFHPNPHRHPADQPSYTDSAARSCIFEGSLFVFLWLPAWRGILGDDEDITYRLDQLVRDDHALGTAKNFAEKRIFSRPYFPAKNLIALDNTILDITKIITGIRKYF